MRYLKRFLLGFSILFFGLLLWNIYNLFTGFKHQEEVKMNILAEAYVQFNKVEGDTDITLITKIIENNNSIPMIVTDDEGRILLDQNIEYNDKNKAEVLEEKLSEMKAYQEPIRIYLSNNNYQNLYYAPSSILNKLRFYPLFLICVFMLFSLVIFTLFSLSSSAQKNKLWNGMAKETAHQIGTPLSSLLGWVAILRTENVDQSYVDEIENDVHHLNVIANRFSNIGSAPKLEAQNISTVIEESLSYFKTRSSKNIVFTYHNYCKRAPMVSINKELISWVLENLFKNAIDAMQGKGNIDVELVVSGNGKYYRLKVTDNGKGIPKNLQKKIFEPGFTTKERGWGLGLSLTKRIIEKYHKGKIFVKESHKDSGTTFCIHFYKD